MAGITTITGTMTLATTTTDGSGLLTLLTWFSPGFPVGAFAYSHGLEAAIAEDALDSAGEVGAWIELLLTSGSGWNDLVLLRQGLLAQTAQDLEDLACLAEALAGSFERRAETLALGSAFAAAASPWSASRAPQAYPLAVAAAARAVGLAAPSVLLAYAHGFCAGLVSAAVRLVPLGQSDAVSLLHRLEAVIAASARRAEASTLDDLGSATILSEIAAMRHESLPTRLFRS